MPTAFDSVGITADVGRNDFWLSEGYFNYARFNFPINIHSGGGNVPRTDEKKRFSHSTNAVKENTRKRVPIRSTRTSREEMKISE